MIEELDSIRNQITNIKQTANNNANINASNNNDTSTENEKPSKEEFLAIQNILQVHGKKISELIKRYKRHHNDINVIKESQQSMQQSVNSIQTRLNEFETSLQSQIDNIVIQQQTNHTSDVNNNSNTTINNSDILMIKEKINKLEKITISEMDTFKDNLAAHEMEHEGIINQLLQDIGNIKQQQTNSLNNSTAVVPDLSVIDAKIDAKISPMQEELEIFVNDKTSKLISTVKKIMSDMGHKIATSHSTNPRSSKSNLVHKTHSNFSQHNRSASMYNPAPNDDNKQVFIPQTNIDHQTNVNKLQFQSPQRSMRHGSKRMRSTSFDMK